MVFKSFVNIVFQLKEGLSFAVESILINKLRTFLSLFGITIGIFSIISVFTVLDALENQIRSNMNSLGTNMVYVSQFPWGPEPGDNNEYKWWKYMNRPVPRYSEFVKLVRQSNIAERGAYFIEFNRTVKYGANSYDAGVFAGSHNYGAMRNAEYAEGRYFTESESQNGAAVAIIGADVAVGLFGSQSPLGRRINIAGKKATVIGVVKREGDNIFGNSMDEAIILPHKFGLSLASERWSQPNIMLEAKDGYSTDELSEEVEMLMRNIRRINPTAENSFSVNRLSLVEGQTKAIFASVNLAGGVIGIFAIIVGGFGIANIMFVSVRERMMQIGVQKAVGAKNYVILMLFLYEAVFLSVIGGILGLLFIYLGTLFVNSYTEFTVSLTIENISLGLGISAFIGALAGYIPAYQASKMEPVKAIFKN